MKGRAKGRWLFEMGSELANVNVLVLHLVLEVVETETVHATWIFTLSTVKRQMMFAVDIERAAVSLLVNQEMVGETELWSAYPIKSVQRLPIMGREGHGIDSNAARVIEDHYV